ncbi:neuropilin and tolloid-like [Anticarsia gemmatalis]|uniref:neuropilin and tolloid-like n=1 Tax=Anticarsia gemmatalis TaxID=129554 RepID=UPI003F76C028
MTSPALFVLSLALVCSICGIASEQADHDTTKNMRQFHLNMDDRWTKIKSKHTNNERIDTVKFTPIRDDTYRDNEIQVANFNMHKLYVQRMNEKKYGKRKEHSRIKRETNGELCEAFLYDARDTYIMHPHDKNAFPKYYYNNSDCVTVIEAEDNMVIHLTFVDMFRIENHPQCAYDYLEVRDGRHGYSNLIDKVCGQAFPRQMTTSGPYAWLKFHSDDTIEYEGFKINIEFRPESTSYKIPQICYKELPVSNFGVIDVSSIDPECKLGSLNHALDVLWTINTPPNTRIYLNFTKYELIKPNDCEDNVIQVFGSVLELDAKLIQYCGSVAGSVTTSEDPGNIMYLRLYASKAAKNSTFRATYNAFRTLNPKVDEGCREDEFDCEDNTCIDSRLKCDENGDAHCRLKADEDKAYCDQQTESTINQPHIMVILIIFSLILSGMSFVFIFKCMRKLYQDHKIIKAHLSQSCEDRLDSMVGSRLTLDPKRLQSDSEPRASLERENHTNEMFKKQRSFSKHKQSSIESDYIQETHLDLDEEPWRREVDSIPIEAEDIRIERNGRTRRSDLSRKEESMRSRTKDTDDSREKKEIRDVSVGAPDTKESGCQTRESLFQTDPPPSSDGSGSNSRGFSTFGYSGATIARPSPPVATNTSEIHIELLKQPSQETKPQKKLDRRPISTETTRSAPDVIIVSKPIR